MKYAKLDSRGMPGRAPSTKKPKAVCSHCGGPCSRSGTTPKSGKRYCRRPECRKARDRERAQVHRVAAVARPAPEACSGCHTPLPQRGWRAGDEQGRWCQKTRCRRLRAELRDEIVESTDLAKANQRLESACIFLMEVVMADAEDYIHSNRVVCHTCGLTSAIPEWIHQDRVGEACMGTLNGVKVRPVGTPLALAGAWPFPRQYLSPEELEAAYGGDES